MTSKVVLDVGGTAFTTSKITLLRFPSTFFFALVSCGLPAQSDGTYFIDRNPKHFDIILDFLRDGELPPVVSTLTQTECLALHKEMKFYQLPCEIKVNNWWSLDHTSNKLSVNWSLVTKPQATSSDWSGTFGRTAVTTHAVFRLIEKKRGHIMIGLAPRKAISPHKTNWASCGYCVHVNTGRVYSAHKDEGRFLHQELHEGSILEVLYSKEQKTITFKVDGDNDTSVTISVNPNEKLYPMVEMGDAGGTVELVSVS